MLPIGRSFKGNKKDTMITAATIIPLLNTLSQKELTKVKSYIIDSCNQVSKRNKKRDILGEEFSMENLRLKVLKDNGTEVIYETKPARDN